MALHEAPTREYTTLSFSPLALTLWTFFRTRHLRNPWNYDREVKVSRDGTELEPAVGQRLLDEWENLASERIPSPAAETPAAKDAPSPAPKRTTPAAREPRRRDAGGS